MEASAGLVAGSHNRNELVVIRCDGESTPRPIQQLSGQICQICGDDVGLNAEEELFVACNECAFPVCRTCYEYERQEEMMMVDAVDEQSCLSNGGIFETLGPCFTREGSLDECNNRCENLSIGPVTKSGCDAPVEVVEDQNGFLKLCNCCIGGQDY